VVVHSLDQVAVVQAADQQVVQVFQVMVVLVVLVVIII